MKKIIYSIIILFVFSNLNAQARLTIENNSQRQMTVKVMKKGGGPSLFEVIEINSLKNHTVYFNESGTYFTKTKATIKGKDPICKKSQNFKVVNDETGYSILTLTYTIKESKTPVSSGGQTISNIEFEKD
jgi:hypothetical protein